MYIYSVCMYLSSICLSVYLSTYLSFIICDWLEQFFSQLNWEKTKLSYQEEMWVLIEIALFTIEKNSSNKQIKQQIKKKKQSTIWQWKKKSAKRTDSDENRTVFVFLKKEERSMKFSKLKGTVITNF